MPEPTEEHRVGAMVLAVASLSARGYLRIERPTSAGWRATARSPHATEDHRAIIVTGTTLTEALEALWAALRAPRARRAR